jgi:hypothetical protein
MAGNLGLHPADGSCGRGKALAGVSRVHIGSGYLTARLQRAGSLHDGDSRTGSRSDHRKYVPHDQGSQGANLRQLIYGSGQRADDNDSKANVNRLTDAIRP